MKELLELIKLVHREAMTAYWATRCHCGSDYHPDCSESPGCECASQCRLEIEIKDMIQKLEAQGA